MKNLKIFDTVNKAKHKFAPILCSAALSTAILPITAYAADDYIQDDTFISYSDDILSEDESYNMNLENEANDDKESSKAVVILGSGFALLVMGVIAVELFKMNMPYYPRVSIETINNDDEKIKTYHI